MVSNRVASNGPDWLDLAEMIAAFEEQNTCFIEVCLHRWTTGGEPDISLVGKAWERSVDRRVAKPLALVNVRCRAERFKKMESAISFLLYQLDFQLGEQEWLKAGKKA